MRRPLIPLARLGGSDCPLGTARRVWSEYVTPVPAHAAELLELEGTTIVQRVLALLVHGQIAVVATSYLPTELLDESTRHDRQWQDGDVDALAMTGCSLVPGSLEQRVWPATPGETEVFRLETDATVTMLSRRYEVGHRHLTAGVILVAPHTRLVLRSGPAQWQGELPTVLLVSPDERVPAGLS